MFLVMRVLRIHMMLCFFSGGKKNKFPLDLVKLFVENNIPCYAQDVIFSNRSPWLSGNLLFGPAKNITSLVNP